MSNFRYGAYLTSQYAWVLILAFFLCIPFFLPANHKTGIITSKNSRAPYSSSQIPTVISHITDMHINHNVPESINQLKRSLRILNLINPDYNIITGDQSDNFGSKNMPRYGNVRPEDFEIYKNLISNFTHIEIDGNHDLFGVYSYESKKKLVDQDIDQYYVSVHDIQIQSTNYSFITLNPYHFPSPHPPLLFYGHATKHFLDLLESAIERIPDGNEIIVLSHFPIYHYFVGEKSSKGNSFQSIIKSNKISFFISGHLHLNTPSYQHHGSLLEIAGSDLTAHKKIALMIIDNDRLSYHPIDITKSDDSSVFAFVTNPLEKELLSDHQVFNEKDTYLRAIVYSPNEPKITASGAVNGQLSCTKESKFWLCQKEMKLEFGQYSITLTGDINTTIDFTIGNTLPSYKEPVYQKETAIVYTYFIQMTILYLFLAIIIIPFKISSKFVDRYQLWITSVNDSDNFWPFSIFAGFIAVKIRIQSLPLFFRIALLVALLWPLCLPTLFIVIESHIGIVWTWGYIVDGVQHYGVWGQYMTLLYLAAILLPLTLLCSTTAISNPCHWSFLFDALFQMIGILVNVYLILRFANEATGMVRSFLSPMYFIIPIFFYISLIVWRFFFKNSLGDTTNIIITQGLLD